MSLHCGSTRDSPSLLTSLQRRPRRLEPEALAEAAEWLEGYRQAWEAKFQRLDALLEEMKAEGKRRLPTMEHGEE